MTKDEALKMALEALESNKQKHNYCEDTWYSCPKHEDGCANEAEGAECNCGADEINAQFDKAITAIKEALAQPEQEPVAYLVLFEGAGQLLEFKKGNYLHNGKVKHISLYTKTEIEIGCSECGIGGGHALYCVACAEKFVGGYNDSGVPTVKTELDT